jgi:hypothetical protein
VTTLVCAFAAIATAQNTQRATADSPFHKDPRGIQLGTLVAEARYRVGAAQGTWVEATIDGWIWSASVGATNRDGFDLVVTAGGGEVVRASPNGAVVARLVEGTLLTRVGAQRGWTHVRRSGWVSREALAGGAPPASPGPSTPAPPPQAPAAAPGPASAPPDSARPAQMEPSAASVDTAAGPRAGLRKGAELATGPDGSRLATLAQAGEVAVVERSRDWVKVRLEGWVKASDLAGQVEPAPAVTGRMLRDEPDRYIGQRVVWRLHFLARQEADELRPEMPKGQPYLLTRGPLPESGFVYVMVSPAQADLVEGLRPLDEIRIDGIIRSGRTRYLPTPVVELTRIVEGR